MRLSKRVMAGTVACVLSFAMFTACSGNGGVDTDSSTSGSSSHSADSLSQTNGSSNQSTAITVSEDAYNNSTTVELFESLSGGTGMVAAKTDDMSVGVIINEGKSYSEVASEKGNKIYATFSDGNKDYLVIVYQNGEFILGLNDEIALEPKEELATNADYFMKLVTTAPDMDTVLFIEPGKYTYEGTTYDSETFTIIGDDEAFEEIYCFKDGELKYFITPGDGKAIEYICCSPTIAIDDLEAMKRINRYTKMTVAEYKEYLASQE